MRKVITVALAALTLGAGITVPASAKPIIPDAVTVPADTGLVQIQHRWRGQCYRRESARDCRERLRWESRYRSRYNYRNGRYYERRSDGSEVAAAILGFALGAAIQGNRSDYDYYYSRRSDRHYLNRCKVRYRSFDPYTGTYVTTTGYRRYCRL